MFAVCKYIHHRHYMYAVETLDITNTFFIGNVYHVYGVDTVITVQPRASANPNFASASPPGASPPRLVAIRAPPDGHLRCAEAHLDSVDDAVVLEDR
ncbi:hypothetical protein M513_07280 [Trichuris suis]|uniref:Uncharacterized protein n=1 Tax=Trichuris suis TaxID=68888 RepID=A0A085M405_9BILA|nr:hypothetical protein M513_07280 [Trichuris suis]